MNKKAVAGDQERARKPPPPDKPVSLLCTLLHVFHQRMFFMEEALHVFHQHKSVPSFISHDSEIVVLRRFDDPCGTIYPMHH